ncbi:MAG: hypothetical protein JW894_11460 [Bacteroidales bacterium]|nr:hypothetical protein [Bacteroidales bacterium]
MKIYLKLIVALITVLTIISCKKTSDKSSNESYFGTWILADYTELYVMLYRASEFIDEYGFSIKADGTFIERKNSGWCATPPIDYEDYLGYWTKINDTVLSVEVPFWGGTEYFDLEIFSVTEDTLKVIYHYGQPEYFE